MSKRVLKVDVINRVYRVALKKITGLPKGIRAEKIHKFFFELELGD